MKIICFLKCLIFQFNDLIKKGKHSADAKPRRGTPGRKPKEAEHMSLDDCTIAMGSMAATIKEPVDLWHVERVFTSYVYHQRLNYKV